MRKAIVVLAMSVMVLAVGCGPNRHMLKPEGEAVGGAFVTYKVSLCEGTEVELSQTSVMNNVGETFVAPGFQNEINSAQNKLDQAVFFTNIDPAEYKIVQLMVSTKAAGSDGAPSMSMVDITDGAGVAIEAGKVASLGYYELKCEVEGEGYNYTATFLAATGKNPPEWKGAQSLIARASEGDAAATAAAADRQENLLPWTDMMAAAFPEPPPPTPEPEPAPAPPPPPEPEPEPEPATLPFEGIEFETGTVVLTKKAKAKLRDLVRFLTENASMRLQVTGHTDNVGRESTNQRISLQRAQAVIDYLLAKGIIADRLEAVGKGEVSPIADNSTAEGRASNRRIHLGILSQ
jgi:outer membrane protein OmpA-like peptidoglycan-associated protein